MIFVCVSCGLCLHSTKQTFDYFGFKKKTMINIPLLFVVFLLKYKGKGSDDVTIDLVKR